MGVRRSGVTSLLNEGSELKIELKKLSQVGNNVLVDMYFDEIKVNPSGPLQMSPDEYDKWRGIMDIGAIDVSENLVEEA